MLVMRTILIYIMHNRGGETMRYSLLIILLSALMLTACLSVKADVANLPSAKTTQALVEEYIKASTAKDLDSLLSLYADDATMTDYGDQYGPINKSQIEIDGMMASGIQKVSYQSYLVTPDGRYAVINQLYSLKSSSTGKWVTVPYVEILEFLDGKIIRDSLYANTYPLRH